MTRAHRSMPRVRRRPRVRARPRRRAVGPALFSGMRWRMAGPFRGGRVLAVAGVPGQPEHFYFGAVGGGVWESHNAGRTWEPIFDAQPAASIGALALAPSDPRVLYVGTGESDMRSDISYGNGMYRSARRRADVDAHRPRGDAPDRTHRRRPARRQPRLRRGARPRVRPQPRARRLPLDRRRAHAGRGSSSRTRTRARSTSRSTPPTRSTILAALWQTRRPPWNTYPPSNGPGQRALPLRGRRRHVDAASRRFSLEKLGRVGLAFAPSDPKRVYALVDAKEGGLWASRGRRRDVDARERRPAHLGARLVLRRADGRSEGRGHDLRVQHGDVPLDRRRPHVPAGQGRAGRRRLPRAADRPVEPAAHDRRQRPGRRRDRRRRKDVELLVQPADRAVLPRRHRRPVPVLDLRSAAGFRRRGHALAHGLRDDHAARLAADRRRRRERIPRARSRPTPRSSGAAASAASTGRRSRTRTSTRRSRSRATTAASGRCRSRSRRALRMRCTSATSSSGARPTPGALAEDQPRPDARRPGRPATLDPPRSRTRRPRPAPRRRLRDRALAARDGPLWCGTDDGRIWRTRDDGGHWDERDAAGPDAVVEGRDPRALALRPRTVYAAVDRHRLDDVAPYVYRTRDGGKTLDAIARGSRRQLRQRRPRGPREAGPPLRRNRDRHLRLLRRRRGLAAAPARTFRTARCGTSRAPRRRRHRDARPLVLGARRRLAAAPARREGRGRRRRLYAPRPRSASPGAFQGTPEPRDEPAAENPPRGASSTTS